MAYSAPPARTEISDTYPNPSNAVARVGFGKLWDYVTGLLGSTGNPTAAKAALLVPVDVDFTNRIINGAMQIDQRNNGASQAVANGSSLYTLDRWRLYYDATSAAVTSQQSSTTTAGFSKALSLTVGAAGSISAGTNCTLAQLIEGLNCADLAMSTSSASPLSLSFWVRSSVTGTFNAAIVVNGYSYVSTYTINAANTFEYKTISIPALTVGTPAAIDNSAYINLRWDLGCGSSFTTGSVNSWVSGTYYKSTGTTNFITTAGATFYITGVQLEKGTAATGFASRPYGTELALCQRYTTGYSGGSGYRLGFGFAYSTTAGYCSFNLPVTMRSAPSIEGTASLLAFNDGSAQYTMTVAPTINSAQENFVSLSATGTSGMTQFRPAQVYFANASSKLILSSEL